MPKRGAGYKKWDIKNRGPTLGAGPLDFREIADVKISA